MSSRIERTLRVYDLSAGALPRGSQRYWATRSPGERLQETLRLHREGNALFKGGNPPFAFSIRTRHVDPA